MVETHLRLATKHLKESRIFFLDEEDLYKGNEINRQIQRDILGVYLKELRTLKALGYVPYQNLTIVAFNIFGVINWLLRWYRPEGLMSMEEIIQELTSFIMHGTVGSLHSRSGAQFGSVKTSK